MPYNSKHCHFDGTQDGFVGLVRRNAGTGLIRHDERGERMKAVRFCLAGPGGIGLLLAASVSPGAAQSWQATVGTQNIDASKQAMAFLPNEM